MTVRNSADDSVGTISDLIIERGSGRIASVVLKAGATFGIGGKEVVVPYSAFGWDAVDKHATLATTSEVAKTWPEFESAAWKTRDQQENQLVRNLSSEYFKSSGRATDWPKSGEPDIRVQGRVARITRQNLAGYPEQTVVTITTDDGRTEQVLVGPTWYLIGSSAPIYRDAPVELYVSHGRRPDSSMVARRVLVNSRETRLYDEKGTPLLGILRGCRLQRRDDHSVHFEQ